MDIKYIIAAIEKSQIKITEHADEEAFDDKLKFDEVYFSVIHGEIIEYYDNDKPYPSCLIFGNNFSGEPIHSVWAYNPENLWAVLITVYRPDPARWINYKKRIKK